MDKFSAMQAFALAAQESSFAEAARKMGMSRSQVNKLVISLEDELNVTLLNRTTRKVTLTPTGAAYLERATRILGDLKEAENLMQTNQETPAGDLKINAPMSFGTMHLNHVIIDFMKLYPEIRIQLQLTDHMIDPVSNGFDMTVRIAAPSETPSLIEHNIVEAKRVICVSPDFLKKYEEPKSLQCLRDLPCLHYGNLPSGNYWKLFGTEGEKIVKVNSVMCSNNGELLRDGAIAGLGVAMLPTFVAGKDLQTGRLISVLRDYRPPRIFLSLLYPPNRHLSARVSLFVKFIQKRFGETPYWDLIE